MRMFFFPFMVFAFLLGVFNIESGRNTMLRTTTASMNAVTAGQTFVRYSQALAVYLNNNPAFTGSVSASQLAGQGSTFPTYFLTLVGNQITSTGANGRIITSFGNLPGGALSAIAQATSVDASYGVSSGTSWQSIAQGSTAQPLAVAVPTGNVVSVVQIGQ